MADYAYDLTAVTDQVGGVVRIARNARITVTNPTSGATAGNLRQSGQPVPYVTSDGKGRAQFTSSDGAVIVTSPNGLARLVQSTDFLQENLTASASAASAASSAAASATAAANSVALVGAPAGAAIDAAVGSGVTMYVRVGGNDSASGKTVGSAKATIAAAVSALGGPGTVVVGDGTFTQSTRTTVPSGVTIRGSGPNSIIKLANGSTGAADLFFLNGVNSVRFLDLAFDGNTGNQTQADANTQRGIVIQNSDNVIVTRCSFKDQQHPAIQVIGATPGVPGTHGVKGLTVSDSSFSNVWTALHITESDSSDVRFLNNVVDGTGEHGFTTYPGCSRVLVRGNLFRNCGTRQSPTFTTYNFGCGVRIFETTDAVVEGNVIENPNFWGIRVTTNNPQTFQQAARVTVSGNVIRGGTRAGLNGGGIMIGEQSRAADVTVTGNTIDGFTAYSDASGILALGDRCTIAGNMIRNVTVTGIRVRGDGCAVSGNTITDAGSYGIELGGLTTVDTATVSGNVIRGIAAPVSRGIYIQSNARNVKASGNSFINVTTPIFNGGSIPAWSDGEYLVTGTPTAGTFLKGERFKHSSPFSNNTTSWVCLSNGTMGTLAGVTGSTTSGSATVTVNTATGLNVGDFIAIAGVTGQKKVTAISGTTVTIDSTADASVSGAAVSYSAASFGVDGAVQLTASATWDPGNIANGAGETSAGIAVSGAALGDYVIVAPPYDLQGLSVSGYVSASAVVRIRLNNTTGAAVDLASGSWKVKVIKS